MVLMTTYKNIILWADSLDNISIGRWEEIHRNVIYHKLADVLFLNRLIILNAIFNAGTIKKKLSANQLTRQMYQIIATASANYFSKFYPDDFSFFKTSAPVPKMCPS